MPGEAAEALRKATPAPPIALGGGISPSGPGGPMLWASCPWTLDGLTTRRLAGALCGLLQADLTSALSIWRLTGAPRAPDRIAVLIAGCLEQALP